MEINNLKRVDHKFKEATFDVILKDGTFFNNMSLVSSNGKKWINYASQYIEGVGGGKPTFKDLYGLGSDRDQALKDALLEKVPGMVDALPPLGASEDSTVPF